MICGALQQLYDEHEVINRTIDRMGELLNAPDFDARLDELQHFIAFFREYCDGYHHGKEEDILFYRVTLAHPGFEPLVSALTDHHTSFRDSLAEAEQAIANGDAQGVREILTAYSKELLDHISAENDELFVAIDDLLNDEEKRTIEFLFVDRDTVRGIERKQELEDHASAL